MWRFGITCTQSRVLNNGACASASYWSYEVAIQPVRYRLWIELDDKPREWLPLNRSYNNLMRTGHPVSISNALQPVKGWFHHKVSLPLIAFRSEKLNPCLTRWLNWHHKWKTSRFIMSGSRWGSFAPNPVNKLYRHKQISGYLGLTIKWHSGRRWLNKLMCTARLTVILSSIASCWRSNCVGDTIPGAWHTHTHTHRNRCTMRLI